MSTNSDRLVFPNVSTWALAVIAIAFVGLLIAGMTLNDYLVGLLITILILALFGMSFNLLFGYTGILSFGHAAFYGTAAYLIALILKGQVDFLPTIFQESFLLAFLLTIAVTTLLAAAIGAFCVQRGDIFFAMLTLAFSMMVYEAAFVWNDLTGGSDGTIMPGSEIDLGIVSFDILSVRPYYYFTLFVVSISILILWRIVNSPYGQILKALRENTERSEFVGIRVKRYQWTSFVLSGVFSAVAGALLSARIFVISPGVLHWSTSAQPILVTLIGGPNSFLGPVVGAFVFIGLEEVITQYTIYWQIGLGAILIPIVLFTQGGLVGIVTGGGGPRSIVSEQVARARRLVANRGTQNPENVREKEE